MIIKKSTLKESLQKDFEDDCEWIKKNWKNNRLPIRRPLFCRYYRQWLRDKIKEWKDGSD